MEVSEPVFRKYIFVCENESDGEICCGKGGVRLRDLLKKRVKELGLSRDIRVSRTGCLDSCAEGPNVLLMPDNVWFKKVQEDDLAQIIEMSLRGVTK